MKKLRNILIIAAATMVTACSDNDIEGVAGISENTPMVTGTLSSVADMISGPGDDEPAAAQSLQSKSQLYYDRVGNVQKAMWVAGDQIGIFSEKASEVQFAFVVDGSQIEDKGTMSYGVFEPADKEAAYPIEKTVKYYSYFPFKEGAGFSYNSVPVSYAGQTQTANEQMYYFFNKNEGDNAAKFLETEKAAAAHLSAYDFMVSNVTSTEGAHVHFNYEHLGSMVRFYLLLPESKELFVDSIQVLNNSRKFFIEGKMDLNDKKLHTPIKESNVLSLKFDPAVDMANYSDADSASYYYWREVSGVKYGCLMAYMMIAPINLKEDGVDYSKLYLLGREPAYYTLVEYNAAKGTSLDATAYDALAKHKKIKIYETMEAYNAAHDPDFDGTEEEYNAKTLGFKLKDATRKYYVATLSKLNFQAGKHHQWSVANEADDTPITFEEITVQEWENATGFNNNGTGTESW